MAFLVLLESLSPTERAVFLLREVFEYGYDEIARVIGKSEDNCRQIAVRARRQVDEKRPRFEASRTRREELAHRFFDAIGEGDAQGSRPPRRRRGRLRRWRRQGARVPAPGSMDATRSPVCCSARRPGERLGVPGNDPRRDQRAARRPVLRRGGRLVAAVSLDIADDLIQTVARRSRTPTSCST
mgnify:CR=1 FL=1